MSLYFDRQRDADYNSYKCKTKDKAIKGVIRRIGDRANYMRVDMGKDGWFSLNIAKIKFKKGFPETYYYKIGDSLIKDANTKDFIIKRDTNIAIYILDCDD